jgi:hypothetical protein
MMRARWQVPLPAVVQNGGSQGSAYVPICVGRVHGVASLSGPTGLGPVDKLFAFDWAVFTAGIYTDAGITIGSTADELGKAYGRRLGGTEFERRIISAKAPRTTIVFSIKDHRVTAIGFGRRGAVDVNNWVSAC